jgi:hypothetical protein
MRKLALFLILLLACAASAESPEAPAPADTVTFTRAELDAMQAELSAIVRKREEAAYQAGRADARQRCASLI